MRFFHNKLITIQVLTFLYTILIINTVFWGCKKKTEHDTRISVVVSILPLAEFAEKIGGDRIQVSVMVPAGMTPHGYEPTPVQLMNINKAQIYVKVGTPIEFEISWLDKILALNQKMVVCNAAQDIQSPEPSIDPHIWLSPMNAQIMVENIYNTFITVDIDNKEYYTDNKENFIARLSQLDKHIREVLSTKKARKFLVYHPAWGHFAKTYDLEQISIEKQGKEPTAKAILDIIENAKKENIHVVFASPQFNPKSAQVISQEIQGKVVMIDPLEKNYIDNLYSIAEQLAQIME